ncbi:MAG: sulfotransferase domain-containing protein [Chloroflexi bacterium]|nr:sulfotransferase domain-containing protein [Chloroflexota bacterium]
MSSGIRKTIKSLADPLRVGDIFRQGFVEINRLGERARSVVYGPVNPSDTIILAGSGRSGTTWLGDLISAIAKAQQIFEPLAPLQNPLVRDLTGWELNTPNVSYIRAFYLAADNPSETWKKHWLDILTGNYRTYWTDANRQFIFPGCYLVKEVYANLMLGYLYKHFASKIVHLVRHPCAVIASRLMVPWHASVKDILSQEELVEQYLRPWIGLIEKEKDLVGAHAVWWAVENMVASRQLSSYPHQFIYYEETVTQPGKIGSRLANWLGRNKTPSDLERIAQKPSRMTQQGKKIIKVDEVLSQWRSSLAFEDQERIVRWARTLGIEWYDLTPMPLLINEGMK